MKLSWAFSLLRFHPDHEISISHHVCLFFKNHAMVLFNKDSFKGDNWQFVFSLYLSLYMFGSISIIMHAF